ncbi:Acetyltransferase (GNAT) family protein [Rhizobium mongolense subsp. loessense]|uniref:Acetyltransferase (GNAT) family protein n=2 Tax=Rhizobium mongolense TaxID=57676 RepID=A0A1G4U5G8_9HYPH|nr:Acetyltransferase (GNAT) family protein [Rhizobium mongolense subsp. loessense]
MEIHITDMPSDEDVAIIENGLIEFNKRHIGPSDRRPLAALVLDEHGEVVGGLLGLTARGWLVIDTLFVPEELRGQGIATRLLETAENEARQRGCHGAWLDTVNADASRLYQKCGYRSFGKLDDLPKGHNLVFMSKSL